MDAAIPTPRSGSASPLPSTSARPPSRCFVKRSGPGWRLALLVLALLLAIAACNSTTPPPTSGDSPGTGPAPTVAVPAGATDLEQAVQTVIRRVQPAVVEVQSSGSQGQGIGSGVVIAANGYIVTNDHVVHGFQRFAVVLATGQTVAATLTGEAPGDDLAVLQASAAGLRPIALGDSDAVQVGTFVLAIGSPLGLDQSATFGIVSALNRTASEAPSGPAGMLTGMIQTSAPINPGNSGGALVNLRGELIGIPTLGVRDPTGGAVANGIGFAIPSNRVRVVTDQLIAGGHLISTSPGVLGITGIEVSADLAATSALPMDRGVLITGLVSDASGRCPVETAGLQREAVQQQVSVTLGERPPS